MPHRTAPPALAAVLLLPQIAAQKLDAWGGP